MLSIRFEERRKEEKEENRKKMHINTTPFTSKPPRYLSQFFNPILSPRISRNLSKLGLPFSVNEALCSGYFSSLFKSRLLVFVENYDISPYVFQLCTICK